MYQINKKSLLLLCAAAALSVGCRQIEPPTSGEEVLKAVIEGVSTKTSYDSIEGVFTWSEGDQIAVFFSDGSKTENEVSVTDGTVTVAKRTPLTRDYYAVYPASAAVAGQYGAPDLEVSLPAAYDITDIVTGATGNPGADFSPLPMVAVNEQSSTTLNFFHVGGILRLTLHDVHEDTHSIRVTLDKDITGTYAVDVTDPTQPEISTAGSAASNVVTFTVAATTVGTLSAPVVLNVPVPCGTYDSVKVECLDNAATPAVLASRLFQSVPLVFDRHHGKKMIYEMVTYFAGMLAPWDSDGDEFILENQN